MGEPARKLNFMIAKDLADALEKLVPSGQRSKLVNEAIRKELLRYRREQLTRQLAQLRETTPVLPEREILAALREDRQRGKA